MITRYVSRDATTTYLVFKMRDESLVDVFEIGLPDVLDIPT